MQKSYSINYSFPPNDSNFYKTIDLLYKRLTFLKHFSNDNSKKEGG